MLWSVFTSWFFIVVLHTNLKGMSPSVHWRRSIRYTIYIGVLYHAPCFLSRGADRTIQTNPEDIADTNREIIGHMYYFDKDVEVLPKFCEGVIGPSGLQSKFAQTSPHDKETFASERAPDI